MTTPTNGSVPAANLAPIGNGLLAEKNTAAAFLHLQAAHPEVHTTGPAAGYWARALDIDVHAHPSKYGVSATEAKNLAPVGTSPHGLGTRLNFAGASADTAKQFGFTEFNAYTYTFDGPYSWTESAPIDPATIAGNQRVARVAVNGRSTRNTTGAILNKWAAGALGTFKGYVHGQTVTIAPYTSNIWLVGQDDGLYYSLAGATWKSTDGMVDLEPVDTTPIEPPASTPVAPPTPPAPVSPTPSPPPIALPSTGSASTPPKAAPTVTKPAPTLSSELAKITADSTALNATVTGAPLAGLFAGHTAGRKRAYAAYAGAALLVSFGPDLVTYQIIGGIHVAALTAWIGFVSSAMLKIGAAFGFVASANTKD